MSGTLYLIPTYLSSANDRSFLAPMVLDVIKNTSYFVVENVRTSRRFISSLKLDVDISSLRFEVLDKNTSYEKADKILNPLKTGENIGIISEAGLPGLADPGHMAVAYAHRHQLKVVPLPGPSSIQTAVIGSGFTGQQFTFHGYLPIQKSDRAKAIKNLSRDLKATGYTQVFMETPFRNTALIKDLVAHLDPNQQLSVSADIFGEQEFILTQSVKEWKMSNKDLHKIPAVFCLGQLP